MRDNVSYKTLATPTPTIIVLSKSCDGHRVVVVGIGVATHVSLGQDWHQAGMFRHFLSLHVSKTLTSTLNPKP